MGKVRYLTISRVALELVEKLTDQENAQFNRIIFSCFQQLENGQDLTYPETDNAILNVALREAAAELETGYRNYIQKITAAKKKESEDNNESANDQRSISEQTPIDKRIDQNGYEKKESSETTTEGMQGGRPFNELEQAQLNASLRYAGISPDPQFWTYAKKAGYRITLDAIKKATEQHSQSISRVVQLMTDAMKGR